MSNRRWARYGIGRLVHQQQHGGRGQYRGGLCAAMARVREHMQGITRGVATWVAIRVAVRQLVGMAVLVRDVVICRDFARVLELMHFSGHGQHRRNRHRQRKHCAEYSAREA